MPATLQEELKQFEKELSLLLVRFMKICDQVEVAKPAPSAEAPKAPAPPRPPPTKKSESTFIAYV